MDIREHVRLFTNEWLRNMHHFCPTWCKFLPSKLANCTCICASVSQPAPGDGSRVVNDQITTVIKNELKNSLHRLTAVVDSVLEVCVSDWVFCYVPQVFSGYVGVCLGRGGLDQYMHMACV